MTNEYRWGFGLVLAASLLGCSAGSGSAAGGEASAASIQLELTTRGSTGNSYRLGPATFEIANHQDGSAQTVAASGEEGDLGVPVAAGNYTVTLDSGWALQRVGPGGVLNPVAATLLSPSAQDVFVQQFQATPVRFAFHLGESGIDIGISVDEGIPDGFDGTTQLGDNGEYSVFFRSGGGSCCWASAAEAQAAFPDLRLFVVPNP